MGARCRVSASGLVFRGSRSILGCYRDTGKENGNYYLGFSGVFGEHL